jgi:hypothetical protein
LNKADHYKALKDLFFDLQKCMKELVPLIDEMRAFKVGVDQGVLQKLHALDSLSSTIVRELQQVFCEDCGALPVWERNTQFSGRFLFCDSCARKHPDFMSEGPGDTFFWKKVEMHSKNKR